MILGCGDSGNSGKTTDNGNDSGREMGSLYGECYPNETCDKGLECDVDNNICLKKSDESGENNDNSNTSAEQTDDNADTNDYGDSIPDDSDSLPDNSDSTPDNDNSPAQTPCNPNPCQNIQNSTGNCTELGTYSYSCGCKTNYTWNSSSKTCNADSKISYCTGLPENAEWNTVSEITQSWNGTEWAPSAKGTYNETESTEDCRFKCSNGFFYSDGECLNPCDSDPCKDVINSTKVCTALSWHDYSCECTDGYIWKYFKCSNPLNIGNICTGQDKCYSDIEELSYMPEEREEFFGQDAFYATLGFCTPQEFQIETIQGDNVVKDLNTNLYWQQMITDEMYSSTDAARYCKDLTYANSSDWRLPTPKELLTIVDSSKYNPSINISNFPNMPTSEYAVLWTSKSCEDGKVYSLELYNGGIHCNSFTEKHNVICVRGEELSLNTFSEFTSNSGDIVVKDSNSGLRWQTTYEKISVWKDALLYCDELNYAGYSDWRLPNKNELVSLLNYDKLRGPYSDFPNMPNNYFLSSSTTKIRGENWNFAWLVSFDIGTVRKEQKTSLGHNNYVRCVRAGNLNYGISQKTANCTGLPANAQWNIVDTVTQTWDGSTWIPSNVGSYNTNSSDYECHYKCQNGYKWNGAQCVISSAIIECDSTNETPCVDSSSGLMWSSESQYKTNWNSAISYCNNLLEGGFSDWHLPTISQLKTLIKDCENSQNCEIDEEFLSDTCHADNSSGCSTDSSGKYSKLGDTERLWSYSACLSDSIVVWYINFLDAVIKVAPIGEYSYAYFRCVRETD